VATAEIKARFLMSLSNCMLVSSFFLFLILISTEYYPSLMEDTRKSEREEKNMTGRREGMFFVVCFGKGVQEGQI